MATSYNVYSDSVGVISTKPQKKEVCAVTKINNVEKKESSVLDKDQIEKTRKEEIINAAKKLYGKSMKPGRSSIFAPFRAIGYVSSDTPVLVQPRGNTYSLISPIGNAFQIYDGEHLRLQFVGGNLPNKITGVAAYRDITFVSSGSSIYVFKRAKPITILNVIEDFPEISISTNDKTSSVELLSVTIFGELLLSHGSDNVIYIWNRRTGEKYSHIKFNKNFIISKLIHPSTYINKILIASTQGELQLWNIRTMRQVYEFEKTKDLFKGKSITEIEQAPALDVIAIGCSDGSIFLINIKYDRLIMKLKQDNAVSSISFRTDNQQQQSVTSNKDMKIPFIMASGGITGDVCLWDLSRKQLQFIMKGAHDRPIHTLVFFSAQPILVTSGSDNSIKQWIFDSQDGTPRLLRSRSGHHKPPTSIKYYDEEGYTILSSGADRAFRSFSVIRDSQNIELSQGSIEKSARLLNLKTEELKLPPISQFSFSLSRERDWDNVITCSAKSNEAHSWSIRNKILGKHVFRVDDNSSLRAVCVTACGNFGIIGSSTGLVSRFNMQSGLLRKSYGTEENRHKLPIVSIHTDVCNRIVVTTSLDGSIKFWKFASGELLHDLDCGSPISLSLLHKDTNLLAIALDDLTIKVIDIETFKIVRNFHGHDLRITDLAFTPDARILVSSSMDCTLKSWDIPTGQLVDIFKVTSIPTSISFSPNGSYLATCHADHVGIFLWANRLQFENVSLRRIDEEEIVDVDEEEEEGYDSDEVEMMDKENELDSTSNEIKLLQKKIKQNKKKLIKAQDLPTSVGMDVLPEFEIDSLGFAERALENGNFDDFEKLLAAADNLDINTEEANIINDEDISYNYESINKSSAEMTENLNKPISVSSTSIQKWYNVLHIDEIKNDSKPEEEPKKPELAPFFLQSTQTLKGDGDVNNDEELKGEDFFGTESRILKGVDATVSNSASAGALGGSGSINEFQNLLRTCSFKYDYTEWIQHIVTNMTPSAVDLAIRTLPCDNAELEDFTKLLDGIEWCILTRNNYDVTQTLLSVFLTVHSDIIESNMDILGDKIDMIYEAQLKTWPKLDDLFKYSFSLIDYARGLS